MFERFTPEARHVLELASALASERGDPTISPDHLLAELAGPASGLAGSLLAAAGVDRAVALAAIPAAAGGSRPGSPPFTPDAKKALELSLREALNLAHAHIGSGHLLLGLLRLGQSPSADTLEHHGVRLEEVRAAVRERSEGPRLGGRSRPRRTGRIIEAPTRHEQARAGAAAPATDEELLQMAAEDGTRLQRALASLGVTAEGLRSALAEVAAEPDDGPVEVDLGGEARLIVGAGGRAAALRSLVGAASLAGSIQEVDGTLRVADPALGEAVWATLEGWLAPGPAA